MLQSDLRSQLVNPAKLTFLFKNQFELCKIKRGDTIAIVSDPGTRQDYIQAAFAAAESLGAEIYNMGVSAVPNFSHIGVPTIGKCKGTLEALMACDMVLIFHIPLFSSWLRTVREHGVRVQMIIDAPDDLYALQSPPGLKEAVLYARGLYEKTKEARVTSKAGTDLTYQCGDFPVMSQHGFADEPGHFDHWGAGLLHTYPNEGSANGVVMVQPGDIIVLPYCRYIQDEVRLEISEGHITKIEGGLDAKLIREWLADGEEFPGCRDPYAVSHLGWGMNPQARWDNIALNGDSPERSHAAARSFPGNFMFSTGPNTQGGGKRKTRGHLDLPMRDCSIALDGRTVVEDGKIVDPKMIVPRERR